MSALSLPLAKLSNGFEKMGYGLVSMALYAAGTICWIMAMRYLSVSTTYLVWLGLDIVIMLSISHFMFGEVFSLSKWFFASLIIVGCVGLHVS